MKLKLRERWIAQVAKTSKNPRLSRYSGSYYHSSVSTVVVETGMFTEEDLEKLSAAAKADKEDRLSGSLQKRIATYQALMRGDGKVEVKNLPALETAMRNFIAKLPNKWLFQEDEDGYLVPYVALSVEYHPRDRRNDNPANVTLSLSYVERGERRTERVVWHRRDILGLVSVEQILAEKEIYPEKTGLLMQYEAEMANYRDWFPRTGMQFLAIGTGHAGYSHSRSLVEDGESSKVVMDDLISDGGEENPRKLQEYVSDVRVASDTAKNYQDEEDDTDIEEDDDGDTSKATVAVDYRNVPVHPYVLVFRLSDHRYYKVHVENLKPYVWDEKLINNLVLTEEKKDLVNILITSAGEVLEDIVKGKTGGVIVLASGPPGTGKTLTAEVYCETTKSPLYAVQCSQLGTNEEQVEKKLQLVLRRAMRWKAILLIDEADVYVRERGSDIQQNAIVGVFLRILERYRGILFLTTNRATCVDDAILSRLTAHLRYESPSEEELKSIWRVLSRNYKVDLSDSLIQELVRALPHISGRSVKNLLKLGGVVLRKEGEKPTAKFFVRMSRFLDIEQPSSN